MPSLSVAVRDPVIRASMLTIFCFGFSGAATGPYQSVIGVRELGLGNTHYATLLLLAATVNVCVSVTIGALADRIGRYRSLMLVVTLFGVTGYGTVFWLPSQASFVLAVLILLPVYNSTNALLFANVRSAANRMEGSDAGAANSAARAMISLAWVLVPGLTAFALAGQASMLPAYLLASAAAFLCVLLVLFLMPRERGEGSAAAVALADRLPFGAALSRPRLLRILAIAMICSMVHAHDQTLPLILTGQAGGKMTDIGVVVGIIAFLEVGLIFVWARVQSRVGNVAALTAGVAIYVAYLAMLSFASQRWQVYALALPAAVGAAALISLPITYLQDLIRERPGLGSSLISVNYFLSAGIFACVFAVGTRLAGYPGSVRTAVAMGLTGLALLLFLDGRTVLSRLRSAIAAPRHRSN
ncbi:MFS transporter [Aureimonas leprariae]|uniref:MFS transporter n=1 Tax=Plantimonas leprariae TaxID=2615207 RepID=A0A7V7TWE3_9HYPH|nr:MFS transporter [Aureimonas leprariae]KAB0679740.1 MFS transporter [Aureimonas leprariae]